MCPFQCHSAEAHCTAASGDCTGEISSRTLEAGSTVKHFWKLVTPTCRSPSEDCLKEAANLWPVQSTEPQWETWHGYAVMHGCGFHYGYYGGPRWMCVVKHSVSTPHCWQNRWLKLTWSHTSRNRGSQAVPKRSSLIFTNALAMGKSKGLEFRGTLRLWPNTTTRTTTLVSDIEPMDSHVPCSKPTSSSGRKMRCLLCHQFFFFLYFPMFSGDASWSIHWLCFRIFRYPDIPDIHWYPPSKLQDPMTLSQDADFDARSTNQFCHSLRAKAFQQNEARLTHQSQKSFWAYLTCDKCHANSCQAVHRLCHQAEFTPRHTRWLHVALWHSFLCIDLARRITPSTTWIYLYGVGHGRQQHR